MVYIITIRILSMSNRVAALDLGGKLDTIWNGEIKSPTFFLRTSDRLSLAVLQTIRLP